jgi:hypothetical protein
MWFMWFMWFRLSALVSFGALVLAADVCGGLPASPPARSNDLDDVAGPMSFRLSVKPGGPAFRITVRSLLRGYSKDPVHAGDIEVARCSDGRRLQLLTIMARQPINFARTFSASDINFDGYLDFSVLGEFGGTWGSQLWWVYEPASGRFVQNELTRELGQLGNNGYQIDSEKHAIQIESLMAGCPPLVTRYRVEDNHLIKVHEESGKQIIEASPPRRDLTAGVPCTVTVSDLVAGTMRVTQVRRFVDGEPVK